MFGSTEYLNNNKKLPVAPSKKVASFAPIKYITEEWFNSNIQKYLNDYVLKQDITSFVTEDVLSKYVFKSDLPTKLSQFLNDSHFVTQNELDLFTLNLDLSLFKVVEQLPTENILTSKIYLVKSKISNQNDAYGEYIYNSELQQWEKLGEQTISLLDYVNLAQFTQFKNEVIGSLDNQRNIIDQINSKYDNYSKYFYDQLSESQIAMNLAWTQAINAKFDAMFDPDGHFKDDLISAVKIEAMTFKTGSTSTNFQLQQIIFESNYGADKVTVSDDQGEESEMYVPLYNNFFVVTNGRNSKLIHYGVLTEQNTAMQWQMQGGYVKWYNNGDEVLPDDDTPYYLYAKCLKVNFYSTGEFVLDSAQIKFNQDDLYYYFLVGVLSTAITNSVTGNKIRLLNVTYGMTTIDGSFIKTGRISSIDGETYFDLEKGEIGGRIKFLANNTQIEDALKDLIGEALNNDPVLNNISENLEKAQQAADAAATAAGEAKAKAQEAVEEANKMTATLNEFSSDGIISPVEKQQLLNIKSDIEAQIVDILSQVNSFVGVYQFRNKTEYEQGDHAYYTGTVKYQQYSNVEGEESISIVDKEYNRKPENDILNSYLSSYELAISAINYYTDKNKWGDNIEIIRTSGPNNYTNIADYYGKRALILSTIANIRKEIQIDAENKANVLEYRLTQAVNEIDKYKYLKEAMEESTDIIGGLVLTSLISVRDHNKKLTGGLNGTLIEGKSTRSIAAWFGGDMVDAYADCEDDDIINDPPLPAPNSAISLFRHDGSGYLAHGNIAWDVEGNLRANLSKLTMETINLFDKRGNSIDLYMDEDGYLILPKTKVLGSLLANQDVVAYALNNQTETVYAYVNNLLDQWLKDNESILGGGGSINWGGITGNGNAVTNITYDTTTKQLSAVKGATFLTAHQDISGKANQGSLQGAEDLYTFVKGKSSFIGTYKNTSNQVWYNVIWDAHGDPNENGVLMWKNMQNDEGWKIRYLIQKVWKTERTLAYTSDITKSAVGLGNVDNTSDANKPVSTATQTALNGKRDNTAPKSGTWFAGTPQIGSDGVMEIGRYIDFHPTSNSDLDYGCRIDAGTSTTAHVLILPNKTGTLAITTDNVASATKLQTARSLWGNSFDGSANIDGTITMGEGTDGRTVKLTNSSIKFIATAQNGWAMNLVARNHADSSDLATLIGGYGNADTYNYTYLGGTYNNPTMVIKEGNIGIGTTNPTVKLRVIGSAMIDGLNLNNCSLTDTNNITPKTTNTKNIGSSTLLYASVYANAYRGNTDELYITNTKAQKDIGFWINNGTNNTQRMLIRGSDGAVGIGTSSPQYKLHVAGGSIYSDTAIRVPNNKPFASQLANGTDINLMRFNDSNELNIGNSSYKTNVYGSTITLNNSTTEKVTVTGGKLMATGTIGAVGGISINKGTYGARASFNYANDTGRWDIAVDGDSDAMRWVTTNAAGNAWEGGDRMKLDKSGNLTTGGNITATGNIKMQSGGYLHSAYQSDAPIVKDHSNGNVTINAVGTSSAAGELFLGYYNTKQLNFYAGTTRSNSVAETKIGEWATNGMTINASSANGLVIKRTTATAGAFVNYYNNNQSNNAWRVGMNSLNSFVWAYSTNGLSSDTGKLTLDTSGNLVATGDVTAYSDKRLKSDIKDLEYRGPLDPKEYIKDGKKCIGFIAQEVREKYPELVLGEESDTEYLSLNYGAITAVLAAENKELRNEVTELKNEVDELKKLINKLIEEK